MNTVVKVCVVALLILLMIWSLSAIGISGVKFATKMRKSLGGDISVSLRISKGCGSTFYPGQMFYIYVETDEPAHVTITVTYPNGETVKVAEFDVPADTEVPRGPIRISKELGEGRGVVKVHAEGYESKTSSTKTCSFIVKFSKPTTRKTTTTTTTTTTTPVPPHPNHLHS